jgi:hypothetical protein
MRRAEKARGETSVRYTDAWRERFGNEEPYPAGAARGPDL